VPSFSLVVDAQRDGQLAEEFASQGWRDRDDLVRLTRSAVVGTVELLRVVQPSELTELPSFVGGVEPGEFLYELTDPVEIEPVMGVAGKLNLWTLPDDIAHAVSEAEEHARQEPPPAVDPQVVEAVRSAARAEEREAFWERHRRWFDHHFASRRDVPEGARFANTQLDALVERALERYVAKHQVRGEGASQEVRVDHRMPGLSEIFGDREWVPRKEFNREVRKYLWANGDLNFATGESTWRDPYGGFSAHEEMEELSKFYEGDDGTVNEVRSADDRLRRSPWWRD
jgi:hypothetical protein